MGHFKVTSVLKLDVKAIIKEYDKSLEVSYKNTAKIGATYAYQFFITQHQGLGTGEMEGSFQARRSRYKNGGWIYGTFSSQSGSWEDSLGGRSVFFEYGRSAPGKGRPTKNRGNWVNTGSAAVGEGQPPRPFMRPSYTLLKGKFPKIVEGKMRGSTKTLNHKFK